MRDLPIRFNPARAIGYGRRLPAADSAEAEPSLLLVEEPTPKLARFALLAFVFFSFAQLAAWLPGHAPQLSKEAPTGMAWLAAQMRLSLTPAVLAFVAIVFYKSVRGQVFLFTGPQGHLMGMFLFFALLSVPFSEHPTYSLWFSLSDMLKLLLLFLLVTNIIRNLRDVGVLLWTLVLCGCIPAVGSLLANVWPDQFALHIDAAGRIGWASYFCNPNRMAQTMCQLVPVALCLIPLTRSFAVKMFLAGLVCLFVLVMLMMFSRIAMITMVMVALVYCVSSRAKLRNLLAIGVVGLLGIVAVPLLAPTAETSVIDRLATVADYKSDASAMSRIALWKAGLDLAWQHPFTGIGVDAFPLAMANYFANRTDISNLRLRWMCPHNSYIEALTEMGIFGLATYLGILGIALWDSWRLHKRFRDSSDPPGREFSLLARGLFLVVIANCIIGLTTHIAYDWMLHMYCALIVCLKQMAEPKVVPGATGE